MNWISSGFNDLQICVNGGGGSSFCCEMMVCGGWWVVFTVIMMIMMMIMAHDGDIITHREIVLTTAIKTICKPSLSPSHNDYNIGIRFHGKNKRLFVAIFNPFFNCKKLLFLPTLLICEQTVRTVHFQFSQIVAFFVDCFKPNWDRSLVLKWKLFQWNSEKSFC